MAEKEIASNALKFIEEFWIYTALGVLCRDWKMAPHYRVLDSAVRCSHGEVRVC